METNNYRIEFTPDGYGVYILKSIVKFIILFFILLLVKISIFHEFDFIYTNFITITIVASIYLILVFLEEKKKNIIYDISFTESHIKCLTKHQISGKEYQFTIPLNELKIIWNINSVYIQKDHINYVFHKRLLNQEEIDSSLSPYLIKEPYKEQDFGYAVKTNKKLVTIVSLFILLILLPPFTGFGGKLLFSVFILVALSIRSRRVLLSKQGIITRQIFPPYKNLQEVHLKKYHTLSYHEKDFFIHGSKSKSYLKCKNDVDEDVFYVDLSQSDIEYIKSLSEKITFTYHPAYIRN